MGAVAIAHACYNGPAVGRFRTLVFATYGRVCHLCGRGGANQVDHLIPRSVRPDLAFDLDNARPAHGFCNNQRGKRALPGRYVAAGW
jgi:5-methylcytosine-specific restriction endonuclease McrA